MGGSQTNFKSKWLQSIEYMKELTEGGCLSDDYESIIIISIQSIIFL